MVKRVSFSLIELVVVIVIIGVVGLAGSQAVLRVYENYSVTRISHQLELQSGLIVTQLSRLLENAIWRRIDINASDLSQISWRGKQMNMIYGAWANLRLRNESMFNGYVDFNLSTESKIRFDSGSSNLGPGDDPFRSFALYAGQDIYFYSSDTIARITGLSQVSVAVPGGSIQSYVLELNESLPDISTSAAIIDPDPYETRVDTATGELYLVFGGTPYLMGKNLKQTSTSKGIQFWREAQNSLIRMQVCLDSPQLRAILRCDGSGANSSFCQIGYCKEGVVLR